MTEGYVVSDIERVKIINIIYGGTHEILNIHLWIATCFWSSSVNE